MTCTPFAATLPTTPAVAHRVLESGVESWRAALDGSVEYWHGALKRGATPLDVVRDVARWWHAASLRSEPTWASPNRIELESELVRLRAFGPEEPDPVVPTLLFPPQAGHSSCIVDYSAEQSQVKTARAAGLTRLYSLDWIGATERTRHAGVGDYLRFAEQAIEHIGGPVNLIGDCQGGWLATIYAALHPEARPHAHHRRGPDRLPRRRGRDPRLRGVPRPRRHPLLRGGRPARRRRAQGRVHAQRLHRHQAGERGREAPPAARTASATRSTSPGIARSRTGSSTRRTSPGDFYLWIVERLFRDNALIRGELEVEGRRVDLAEIRCPLNLLAGSTDHITPPDQVFALAGAVSTPAADIAERVTGGGHLGLFMGREALREHWPAILADVYERSRLDGVPGATGGRARSVTPPDRDPIPAP